MSTRMVQERSWAPCRGRGRGRRAPAVLLALLGSIAVVLTSTAQAHAGANPQDSLIYMPYGLIHTVHPTEEVDEYLSAINSYDIGQIVYATPTLKKLGILKMPKHNLQMLTLWSQRVAAYNTAHASRLGLTIVFSGKVKRKPTAKGGLELVDPTTRANIVSGVRSSLSIGLAGVQLDFEPYPTTAGFLLLLEELDAMFTAEGFHGRFSVTAPATISYWMPAYLDRVSQLVTQIDPLYYDSESSTVASYQQWMIASLAYYSANVAPATRIVPVLPSYSADRWHIPAVENVDTATEALATALADGSRINGAGIWSGWGFLLDEEGAYDGAGDRAAWRSSTVELPFSP